MLGRIDWSPRWNAFIMYAFHPAAVLRVPDNFPDFAQTIRRIQYVLSLPKGEIERIPTRFHVAPDASTALGMLLWMRRNCRKLAVDIETDNVDWLTAPVLEIGFSWQAGYTYIIPARLISEDVQEALCDLLSDPTIEFAWHNGKFDTQFLRHRYHAAARVDVDTMLMHYALDERPGIHGLKALSRVYCNAPAYEDEVKKYVRSMNTPFSACPEHIRHPYLAYDADYTGRLRDQLRQEHAQEAPSRLGYPTPMECHDQLLVPLANDFVEIEMHGVLIDREYLTTLRKDMEEELATIEGACKESAFKVVFGSTDLSVHQMAVKMWKETNNFLKAFNIRSPQQVAAVLYDAMKLPLYEGKRTTDVEALRAYERRGGEFVRDLLRYRNVARLYGTYVKGFDERMDPSGRVHPDFLLHGTVTGRLSCHDPNVQNIPRDSAIKKLFIASPGHTFVSADYKQLEVRVAAFYSGDVALQEALKYDIHWEVAKQIFGHILDEIDVISGDCFAEPERVPQLETILNKYGVLIEIKVLHTRECFDATTLAEKMRKHLRFMTKFVTFGILYGRGAASLAKDELQCSTAEAQRYVDNFFARFPQLTVQMKQWQKDALQEGWIETPTGRRRRFPFVTHDNAWKIEHQAVNTPIQSLASDINLLALHELHAALKQRDLGYVLFPVHDSIELELRTERLDEGLRLVKAVMEGVVPDSPIAFPVDIEFGPSWGDTQDWDGSSPLTTP